MPIFARRILQNLIDVVSPLSTPAKIQDQIRRLETGGQDAIAVAWELAVMAGLSQMGTARVEPDLETSTRVDFELSMPDLNWAGIGDIVTVFDHGMHEESGYGPWRPLSGRAYSRTASDDAASTFGSTLMLMELLGDGALGCQASARSNYERICRNFCFRSRRRPRSRKTLIYDGLTGFLSDMIQNSTAGHGPGPG